MLKGSFAPYVLVFMALLHASVTTAQTNTPVGFTSLTTSSLANTPPSPGVAVGHGCTTCTGGSCTNWTYAVVALDPAGGNTQAGTSMPLPLLTTGPGHCATHTDLSSTGTYLTITTQPVPGAASCVIYRTSPTATGDVGIVAPLTSSPFPCGATLVDFGITGDGSSPPTNNSTGTVNAGGMVEAQAFYAGANGSAANPGTEILNTGSTPLSTCASSVPPYRFIPCIPQGGSFYQQAPSSIVNSWGITWPQSFPTSPGPFIFGAASGATENSNVSIASLANNQVVNGSSSQGLATGFSATLGSGTAGNLAAYTSSSTVGNCAGNPCINTIGVFTGTTPSPTWIASGEATVNIDGTGYSAGDILCNSSSGSVAHDNGAVSCASGQWVGFVKTTSVSGSTPTAFISLR